MRPPDIVVESVVERVLLSSKYPEQTLDQRANDENNKKFNALSVRNGLSKGSCKGKLQ